MAQINTGKAHILIDSIAEWQEMKDKWIDLQSCGYNAEKCREFINDADKRIASEKAALMVLLWGDET